MGDLSYVDNEHNEDMNVQSITWLPYSDIRFCARQHQAGIHIYLLCKDVPNLTG